MRQNDTTVSLPLLVLYITSTPILKSLTKPITHNKTQNAEGNLRWNVISTNHQSRWSPMFISSALRSFTVLHSYWRGRQHPYTVARNLPVYTIVDASPGLWNASNLLVSKCFSPNFTHSIASRFFHTSGRNTPFLTSQAFKKYSNLTSSPPLYDDAGLRCLLNDACRSKPLFALPSTLTPHQRSQQPSWLIPLAQNPLLPTLLQACP